ncbi:hypothetical protein OIU77_031344 [Salix suchowensis]|uniref:Uncharacterized protein n=1 Tax=Salix suchowensis TaxID=1278906 RepID=A0ABQ9BF62_9ROSI|nr:hypothetical protein OIU77_031344 [Salix suchowensis]
MKYAALQLLCPLLPAPWNLLVAILCNRKVTIQESSVDLNANSKSSDATAAPPAQENLLSSEGSNCSSHESSGKKNALPAPKPNTLEFLLMELPVPSVIPADSTS